MMMVLFLFLLHWYRRGRRVSSPSLELSTGGRFLETPLIMTGPAASCV